MTDASTLIVIAGVSCVVVPWLICRSFPPVENTSRAIRRNLEKRDPHQSTDGDRFAVPPFHIQPTSAEVQHDHA